jgi:hypothetical protein
MNPRIAIAVIGGFMITRRDCSEIYSERHSFAACRDPQFVAWSAFNERASYTPPGDLQYVYIDRMRLLCRDGTLKSCTMDADGSRLFTTRTTCRSGSQDMSGGASQAYTAKNCAALAFLIREDPTEVCRTEGAPTSSRA